MAEHGAHHKENTIPQRAIAHPPKHNCVREKHLSDYWFGNRFTMTQNSHIAFLQSLPGDMNRENIAVSPQDVFASCDIISTELSSCGL